MENKNVLKLSKAYNFEGKTYSEIDMTEVENTSGDDIINAERNLAAQGGVYAVPNMSVEFSFAIAAQKTGLPIEFFKKLNGKDTMKIKNRVTNFLFVED